VHVLVQGALDIGIDIPSAQDVVEMQELIEQGDKRTIVQIWQEKKQSAQRENGQQIPPTKVSRPSLHAKIKLVRHAQYGEGDSPRGSGEGAGDPAVYEAPDGFQGAYDDVVAHVLALEEQPDAATNAAAGKGAIYEDPTSGFKGTYAEVVAHLEAQQKEAEEGEHPPMKAAKSERGVLAQKWQEFRGRAPSAPTGIKLMRRASGGGGGQREKPETEGRRSRTVSHVEMVTNPMEKQVEKPVSV